VHRVLLCSPGWLWTHNPPALTSWVLGLQACTIMLGKLFGFYKCYLEFLLAGRNVSWIHPLILLPLPLFYLLAYVWGDCLTFTFNSPTALFCDVFQSWELFLIFGTPLCFSVPSSWCVLWSYLSCYWLSSNVRRPTAFRSQVGVRLWKAERTNWTVWRGRSWASL
jgi:hypothetical protein